MPSRITSLVSAALLVASTAAFGQTIPREQYEALLVGTTETPSNASTATGNAWFVFNPSNSTIFYKVDTTLAATTAAHIHLGAVGAAGGVLFPLAGGPSSFTGVTPALTVSQVSSLRTSGLYVNVHTAAFPNGEIRGQMVAPKRFYFGATLNGAAETPPNPSPGSGTATFLLSEPENLLYYDVTVQNLTTQIIAAHVHQGAAGTAGGVVFPLTGNGPHYCGVGQLTAAQVTACKGGLFYVNVHTTAFSGGEVRGQLAKSPVYFAASMDGGQETPPTASAATACAGAVLNTNNTVTYHMTETGLGTITAAHLHQGPLAVAGGVIFPLSGAGPTFSGTGAALTQAQADSMLQNGMYFNMHTAPFPNGEIRGQIRPSTYNFGWASPGTGGAKPRVWTPAQPVINATATVGLINAPPGASATLYLGFNNTFAALLGVSLPLDLSTVGIPGGQLWLDFDPNFGIPAVCDSTGCATVQFSIPNDPSLSCFRAYFQWLVTDPSANAAGLTVTDCADVMLYNVNA